MILHSLLWLKAKLNPRFHHDLGCTARNKKHQNTKTALDAIAEINIGIYAAAFSRGCKQKLSNIVILKYHTLVWSKGLKPKLIYDIHPY